MDANKDNEKNVMLDAMNSVHEVKVGDVVKGEVLAIDDHNQLVVGIEDSGVEGVVPAKELSNQPNEDVHDLAKVGDILDLVVISSIGNDKENGSYLLSKRRLEARKIWDDIEKEYETGKIFEVPVTSVVRGGLVVDLGVRGFIPASMVDTHFTEDLKQYQGKTVSAKIIEIEPSENRLILSRRVVLEAERKEQREELLSKLVVGDVIEGTVERMTNFGAFINIGGIDGLVHVSEISYERVTNPKDVLELGQKVQVKVLSVDKEKGRISLSMKAALPDPWDNITEEAPIGSTLDGKVKRLTTFGAFVEVFPGIEGLVHISQISHKHIATPNEVLKEGQDIKVKVLEVNATDHRLALSVKALQEKPEGMAEDKEEAAPKDVQKYEAPEENTGFSIGDMIGKANKE